MQKRIKPVDRHPKAGDTVPLVVTQVCEVGNDTLAANQPKRGKLNYQAKPRTSAPKPKLSPPQSRPRNEHRTFSQGKYIGDGEKLTAFVWLDDEPLPMPPAANDPK